MKSIILIAIFSLSLLSITSSVYAADCTQWTKVKDCSSTTCEFCADEFCLSECSSSQTAWNGACWTVNTQTGCSSCGPSGECLTSPICPPSSACSEVNPCQRYNTYSDCSTGYTTDNNCTSLCSSGQCSGGSCVPTCTPQWSCNSWSDCITTDKSCSNTPSGTRIRACNDGCGNTKTELDKLCTLNRNTDGNSCITPTGASGTCSGETCVSSDTTPPVVKNVVIQPTAPYELGTTITVSADASDNVGVTSCSVKIGETDAGNMQFKDGISSPCGLCSIKKSYTISNPPIIPSQTYIVTVTCSDSAGNTGQGSTSIYVSPSSIDLVAATFYPTGGSIPLTYARNTLPPDEPATTLQWDIPGANCYFLEVNEKRRFVGDFFVGLYTITYKKTTTNNEKVNLDLNKDYEWRVKASADNCNTYPAQSRLLEFKTCGNTVSKSDSITVGSCSVDITTQSPDSKYLAWGEDKNGRTASVDTSSGCDVKLAFDNSWSSNVNTLTVTTKELSRNCGLVFDDRCQNAKYGYTLSSNCKFLKIDSCTSLKGECPHVSGIGTSTVTLLQDKSYKSSTITYKVGECLTNQDCVTLKGQGSTCNTQTNMCTPSTQPVTLQPPTLLLPANGATVTTLQPVLDWTDVTGASNYKFYVKTATQTESSPTYSFCASDSTGVAIGLSAGNTYYWSAKACSDSNCNTCGNYASEWNFATQPAVCDPAKDITLPDGQIVNPECVQSTTKLLGICDSNKQCQLPYSSCSYNQACDQNYCCGSTLAGGPGGIYTGKCVGPGVPKEYSSFLCTK